MRQVLQDVAARAAPRGRDEGGVHLQVHLRALDIGSFLGLGVRESPDLRMDILVATIFGKDVGEQLLKGQQLPASLADYQHLVFVYGSGSGSTRKSRLSSDHTCTRSTWMT